MGLLPTITSAAATLLLLLAALTALLLLQLLLRRKRASRSRRLAAIAGLRAAHPTRRAVVGVEPRRVLEGAKASAGLGSQSAIVAVPRGLRCSFPVRRVESFLVRQGVSVADESARVTGRTSRNKKMPY